MTSELKAVNIHPSMLITETSLQLAIGPLPMGSINRSTKPNPIFPGTLVPKKRITELIAWFHKAPFVAIFITVSRCLFYINLLSLFYTW